MSTLALRRYLFDVVSYPVPIGHIPGSYGGIVLVVNAVCSNIVCYGLHVHIISCCQQQGAFLIIDILCDAFLGRYLFDVAYFRYELNAL